MHCKSKLAVSITATILLSLLSATSYAGWYCVKMPTGGNSGWTKRDNAISVRFKYHFTIKNWKGELNTSFTTDGKGEFDVPYTQFNYKDKHVCVDMRRLEWDLKHFVATSGNWPADSIATVKAVQADIRYGGDCPKISNLDRNVLFRTWRRSGNHVNPWDCDGPLDNINWSLLTKYNMQTGANRPVSAGGLKHELLREADGILKDTAELFGAYPIVAQAKTLRAKIQAVRIPPISATAATYALGDLVKLPDYRWELHELDNQVKYFQDQQGSAFAKASLVRQAETAQQAAAKKGRHALAARCKRIAFQIPTTPSHILQYVEKELHGIYKALGMKPEESVLHLLEEK